MANPWDKDVTETVSGAQGSPWDKDVQVSGASTPAIPTDARTGQIQNGEHVLTARPYAIPEGAQVSGTPILPPSAMIPSAVGYGVSKLGEHLGLPGWENNAAGLVAGGAAGLGGAAISRLSSLAPGELGALGKTLLRNAPVAGKWIIGPTMDALDNTPEPFEPVRPNPAVAAKMRFGGPVDTSGGSAFPKVGMSGAPEAPTPGDAFQPNKVNPNIASRLRFGGPIDAEGAPSYGRVGMSGAPTVPLQTEPAAAPFQPNRVNPNIARGIRYTPGGDDASGAAVSPSTVGTRAEMMRQLRLRQAANASPQITNPPIATPPATDAPTFANGGIKLNIRRR